MLAAVAALFFAVRIASARVTLLPGLTVPAAVPLGAGMLAVVALAVVLVLRGVRRFPSCPYPHAVWGAP
jgi:hypothetical protein